MKQFYANTSRGGVPYTATVSVFDGVVTEFVTRHGPMGGVLVHEADFPESCLGTASRDEYTRVMLASVADKDALYTSEKRQ